MHKLLLLCLSLAISACTLADLPPGNGCGRSSPCESIAAGSYYVELIAAEGSGRGRRILASLRLEALGSELHFSPNVRLYGWLKGDLSAIGAPICADQGPAADSDDPRAPGVLVHQDGDKQYLSVAHCSHHAASSDDSFTDCYDGCGIILEVDEASAGRFGGRWGAYGIVVDGAGTFEARPASKPKRGESP